MTSDIRGSAFGSSAESHVINFLVPYVAPIHPISPVILHTQLFGRSCLALNNIELVVMNSHSILNGSKTEIDLNEVEYSKHYKQALESLSACERHPQAKG